MMEDQKIEIIFDEDPNGGPVADYMRRYSSKDFDAYVVREISDGTRRDLATESANVANALFEVFGRQAVKADFKYLRDSLISEHKARLDILSNMRGDEGFGRVETPYGDHRRPREHVANYSGPELFDLAKIAVTIGGSALTVAAVKATKDIIIAWIKARAGRKLTLKVGGNTLTIQGATSDKEIEHATQQLERIAAVAKPAKEKPAKDKPPPLEKAQRGHALPAPDQEAQPGRKKPAKKEAKPKQQS
jgi:hypothetical protein